jgi:hypothetical protein
VQLWVIRDGDYYLKTLDQGTGFVPSYPVIWCWFVVSLCVAIRSYSATCPVKVDTRRTECIVGAQGKNLLGCMVPGVWSWCSGSKCGELQLAAIGLCDPWVLKLHVL